MAHKGKRAKGWDREQPEDASLGIGTRSRRFSRDALDYDMLQSVRGCAGGQRNHSGLIDGAGYNNKQASKRAFGRESADGLHHGGKMGLRP